MHNTVHCALFDAIEAFQKVSLQKMINFLARKASIEVKTYHHFFSIEPQFFNQKSYTVH